MTPGTLRAIAVYTFVVAKALCMADRPGELVTRGEIEAAADELGQPSSPAEATP